MPRIDAIDLAQVAPAWVSSQPAPCRQALHFHSGVSAEALPFDDNSFDLVTSQYGLEYCDDVRTAPEVARRPAPAGRVALLLPPPRSRPAQAAAQDLRPPPWPPRPRARGRPALGSSQPAPGRQALHFHSGVSAEALPFDDNSFDLVTSQYGIEYCDDVRTAPEVARVLAPDGRVALLLHHADSRLAQVAREELRLADWLLRPAGFLDLLQAIVPWVAQAATVEGRERLRDRSEEHTSELQSLMRISYAVSCLKKKKEKQRRPKKTVYTV